MQKQRVFWASAFATLLILCLFPGMARANNVLVDCNAGGSINAVLATLPPTGPNTITVTGTCNESVALFDARSLTIVAGASGAKIIGPQDNDVFDIVRSQFISLVNLEIAGVPGSTFGSGGFGVTISEFSDVQILGCDIHDNEGGGVLALNSSVLSLRNTNIHNNTPGNGLNVNGNSTANVRATTIQDNGCAGLTTCFSDFGGGIGVLVTGNSAVHFSRNTLIQNNGNFGIWARLLSTVGLDFNFPLSTLTTVQGHNIDGIYIQEGAHLQVFGTALVQGNGIGCPPETPIPCGGIFATENATLEFNGFGTVSGNQGSGIFVEQGTNLHLGGGVTVSNNSGDGVHIQRISIGDFTPILGSGSTTNTITGNGGASVFCDARSLVIGNLTGFSKVNCGQTSQ